MSKTESCGGILKLLRENDDFVVAGHVNPDGDAVGACYGLALALEAENKNVKVFLEPYAARFEIIPGRRLLYEGSIDALQPKVMLCVDCGEAERLGRARPLYEKAEITACIDHHMTNKGFATYNFIEPSASSASEMVYKMISPGYELNSEIASALYAGIVWDTDGFRFDSVSPETLRITSELISYGIPFTEIYAELLHRKTYIEAKLFGKIMDSLETRHEGKIMYACVTRAMLKELKATAQNLDGVVESLLNIRGAEVSLLLYEKSSKDVKASFRSRSINVGRIAEELGGGGHRLAAGCSVTGEISDICGRIIQILERELEANE